MNECLHENTEVRWRNRTAGLIARQCVDCLRPASNWLPHDGIDKALLQDWVQGPLPAVLPEQIELLGPRDRQVLRLARDEYETYLGSADWQRRRAKVMRRADGICEGCLTNSVEEVHHLTYAHVGAEFAFELIAVCRRCHERLHRQAIERSSTISR